jgi:glycosyltransferase involved in cell wall biosynthesis
LGRQPRISVVIPVYRARYLADCLDSVFRQTRLPDQVVVVDDGSPDSSTVKDALAPFIGHLTYLTQKNLGAGAARNRGIQASSSDLVAFLDSDDMWVPEFLAEQLRLLFESPDRALVYSNALIVGDGPLSGQLFTDKSPSRGQVTVESLLAQRCNVVTSSVLVKRDWLVRVGMFDETLRRGQDFDLWVRLAAAYAPMAYTTVPLVRRRVHNENLSGTRVTELERASIVLERLRDKLVLDPRQTRVLDRRVAFLSGQLHVEHGKRTLASGDVSEAAAHFARAARAGAGWKSHAVAAALRVAPGLTRHFYLATRQRAAAGVPVAGTRPGA